MNMQKNLLYLAHFQSVGSLLPSSRRSKARPTSIPQLEGGIRDISAMVSQVDDSKGLQPTRHYCSKSFEVLSRPIVSSENDMRSL